MMGRLSGTRNRSDHPDPVRSSGQVDFMDDLDAVDILANWRRKTVSLIVDYMNTYLYFNGKK